MVSDMRVNLLRFDFSYLGWIRPNETLITPSYIIKELKLRDVIGLKISALGVIRVPIHRDSIQELGD